MSSSCCSNAVRVRFAPSPTGNLHIGGLRTALFNWLLARHTNGVFLLRIEDTDLERSKQEYVTSIIDSLSWAGIVSDEPVVMQMNNAHKHTAYAQELIKQGKAYKCYCPKEEYLEGSVTPYQQLCRDKDTTNQSGPYAIRLKVNTTQESITFNDLICGEISLDIAHIDDFIIVRSDGTPVYNFVVVLDDISMRISHVIRGQEHISNTFRQLLIYEAFGIFAPQFAHLPMILSTDGSKLSKRQGATNVLDYRKEGYFPEALCNYLARLGWSHNDQEIFTQQQLITLFDLDAVGAKGSIFDPVKLAWVNSVYMKAMTAEQILQYINDHFNKEWHTLIDQSGQYRSTHAVIDLFKQRVDTLRQLTDCIEAMSKKPDNKQQDIPEQIKKLFRRIIKDINQSSSYNASLYKSIIKNAMDCDGLCLKDVAPHIRKALTGQTEAAGVFELMNVLSSHAIVQRFERYITV